MRSCIIKGNCCYMSQWFLSMNPRWFLVQVLLLDGWMFVCISRYAGKLVSLAICLMVQEVKYFGQGVLGWLQQCRMECKVWMSWWESNSRTQMNWAFFFSLQGIFICSYRLESGTTPGHPGRIRKGAKHVAKLLAVTFLQFWIWRWKIIGGKTGAYSRTAGMPVIFSL